MLCRLEQRTGGQVIPTATKTVIQFDKIAVNSVNAQVGTAPWTVIPVNFAGTYIVSAMISLDTGTTGYRIAYIEAYDSYTGWVTVGSTQIYATGLTGYKILNCVAMVSLLPYTTTVNSTAQREQVRVSVYHTQGASITVAAPSSANYTPVSSLSLAPAYPA
jgi:hypothetical protein